MKQAEQAAVKANADFYWRKSVMEIPSLRPVTPSPAFGKKSGCKSSMPPHIGQEPARPRLRERHPRPPPPQRRRAAGPSAQKLGGFVTKNKHTLLIVGGIGLILMLIMG